MKLTDYGTITILYNASDGWAYVQRQLETYEFQTLHKIAHYAEIRINGAPQTIYNFRNETWENNSFTFFFFNDKYNFPTLIK